jgi:hypothetical protein
VEHERHPFGRGEGVHDDVQGDADGVRQQGLLLGIDPGIPGRLPAEHPDAQLERLLTVAAWYENPLFDEAERAALALTEAATRLSDRPGAVTDEIWAEAARHYDERQLGALVLMVAITNFFNRINTTLRIPAGARWD